MKFSTQQLIFGILCVSLLSGCSALLQQPYASQRIPYDAAGNSGSAGQSGIAGHIEPSIIVQTRNNAVMTFEDGWGLTWSGISGKAEIRSADNSVIVTDTTLSYWDVSDAAPARRDNTTRQFLLTILGVILVIGLAAIILYAAFIATDR